MRTKLLVCAGYVREVMCANLVQKQGYVRGYVRHLSLFMCAARNCYYVRVMWGGGYVWVTAG